MWIAPATNPDLGPSGVTAILDLTQPILPAGRMVTRSACASCASVGTTTCGHASIDAKGEIRVIRERLRRDHGIIGMGR